MNKAELALKLSEKLNVPKKTAEDIVEVFETIVTQALTTGEEVTIAGFGTFSARTRSARMGVNPRNPTERQGYRRLTKSLPFREAFVFLNWKQRTPSQGRGRE